MLAKSASCLLLYTIILGAQQPEIASTQAPATFTSGVNLISVPVVVRDSKGRAIGSLRQEDFRLLDQGKQQIITKFSVQRNAAADGPPAQIKSDSLVAHEVQLIPSGSLVFGMGEQAFCYFEIYAAGPTAVSMRARVLDTASGAVKWDGGSAGVDRPSSGGDRIPVEFGVPIASLPPGAWTLEVIATEAAGGSARRTIDFKIR